MALSQDPVKRAKQEAALRKGNPRAFTRNQDQPGSQPAPSQAALSQAEPGSKPGSKPRAIRVRGQAKPGSGGTRSKPASQAKATSRSKASATTTAAAAPAPARDSFWDGLLSS